MGVKAVPKTSSFNLSNKMTEINSLVLKLGKIAHFFSQVSVGV